ncbi:MAG: hypothetical protein ACRDYC_00270, partial [Acidimicrobiales bacterium]
MKPRVTAAYNYRAATGEVIYQVRRWTPKNFTQARPDGNGGWLNNLDGIERILYRLPEVLAAVGSGATIWVVEGERDVEAVRGAGGVATCNSGGASATWSPNYSAVLAGAARVMVVADRDQAGYRHARDISRGLAGKVGHLEVVRSLEGKDASDHIEAGHSLGEMTPLGALELDNLCADPPAKAKGGTTRRGKMAPAEQVPHYELSELGNARRMVDTFGVNMHHVPEQGRWFAWSGRHWAHDLTGQVDRWAKAIGEEILEEGYSTATDKLVRWGLGSCNAGRIKSAISLAATEPGIPILVKDLDRDDWALNTMKGTLDLRS